MCFLIKRQEYLEALSIIGAGGEMHITNTTLNIQRNTNLMDNLDQKDMGSVEVVTELLKQIQNVSPSVKEFNSLSLCLTLEKLTDNPQYSDWSVSKGRIEVMDEIYDSIRNLIPQSQFDNDLNESMTPSTHPNPGNRQGPLPGIYDLIAMASKYQYMEIQRNELKVKSNDSDKKKSSSMFIDVKSDTSGEKEESTGDGQQVTSAEEAEVILYPTLPSELNTMYASGGMIRSIPCLNAAHEEMEVAAGSRCHCIEKCDSSVFNPIIRVTNRISTHRADRNIIHRTDYVSNTNEDYVSGRSVNTSALPHANAEFGGTGAHMTSTNVDPNGATIRTNSHVHYDGEDSGMESRLEPETSTAATNDVMEVLSVDKRCSVLEPAMNQLKPRPSVAFEVTDNGLQTFNKVSLPKPPLARRKHAQPQPSGDSNSGDMDPASVIQVRHEHEPKQKNVSNFQKFLESKKQELAEGNINGTDVAVRIPKSPSRSTAHALSRTHALMVPAPESEGESVGMTRALSSEDSSLWLNPSGADATLLFQSPVPLRCITMLPSRHRSDAENTCVVGSNNKSLYMMQYSEGTEPTCEIVAEFKDLHRGSVYCCDAIHNPENMRPVVATGSNDKSIRLIE